MTVTFRFASSLAALFLTFAAGCSSTSSSAPAAGADAQTGDAAAEGSPEDAAGDEDTAVTEPADTAPRDTGTAPDTKPSAADTSVANTTTACHSLVDNSSGVTSTFNEGTPPTAAGGQPIPGVYVLTSVVQYGGSFISEKVYGTIKISTSSIDRAVKTVRTTDGFSASGDTIYLYPTCGGTGTTTSHKYTATTGQFVEHVPHFGGTQVLTYIMPI